MNRRFLPWVLLYALLIAYSSTIVGPMGLHYVPMDPDEAWRLFLARAFAMADTGSDQRADWMGNLSMFVPFGFLLTGFLWPRRNRALMVLALPVALAIGLGFILVVKYAQLYFPPRTVTLNYVIAQSSGIVLGLILFLVSRARFANLPRMGAREGLRRLLTLYSAALFLFVLMPLDFALDINDLLAHAATLPDQLLAIPGEGRPRVVRAALLVGGTVATAPFGMLLVLAQGNRNRFFSDAMARGVGAMVILLVLTALLISGAPALISLVLRCLGIAIGIAAMRWLVRQDPHHLRRRLRALSLFALPPYLLLLLAVNGLLSIHWRTVAEAIDATPPLGLWPLYNYYIVTKADAAKNIVAHLVMYAPLGVLAFLRGWRLSSALLLAAILAAAVEFGRALRPGLEGDVNTMAVAGAAAWFTAWVMPFVWQRLAILAYPAPIKPATPATGWRERAAAAKLRQAAAVSQKTETEHF